MMHSRLHQQTHAMTMQIRKAERKQAKLRIGISAPSGAGKTYSALLLARGLASNWDKILLIDTENGSGELYSNLGGYNVVTLNAPFSPEHYIEAITAGQEAGMEVIIVDSVSHEWEGKGGCLESNELLGQTKFRGNSWAAWSVTTPKHQKFIEAITTSSCDMITTARSKVETMQTDDKKIKKVGTKEIQREGFEYELTVNFNIDRDRHLATASKDRTGLFIDRDAFVITQKTGEEIRAWNDGGAVPIVDPIVEMKKKITLLTDQLGIPREPKGGYIAKVEEMAGLELVETNFEEITNRLSVLLSQREADETKTNDTSRKHKAPARTA